MEKPSFLTFFTRTILTAIVGYFILYSFSVKIDKNGLLYHKDVKVCYDYVEQIQVDDDGSEFGVDYVEIVDIEFFTNKWMSYHLTTFVNNSDDFQLFNAYSPLKDYKLVLFKPPMRA